MGPLASCCRRRGDDDFEEQYQTLVRSKPAPVNLDSLDLFGNSDDGERPSFQLVPEDDQPPAKPKRPRGGRKKRSK
jgi:hypothetical protein